MKKLHRFLRMGIALTIILSIFLSISPKSVSAISGTAVINPIESNIAVKFWITATPIRGLTRSANPSLGHGPAWNLTTL